MKELQCLLRVTLLLQCDQTCVDCLSGLSFVRLRRPDPSQLPQRRPVATKRSKQRTSNQDASMSAQHRWRSSYRNLSIYVSACLFAFVLQSQREKVCDSGRGRTVKRLILKYCCPFCSNSFYRCRIFSRYLLKLCFVRIVHCSIVSGFRVNGQTLCSLKHALHVAMPITCP